ncbi:hypothetical protein R2R35_18530 [Anaerocolumna sp. AGMB13020]|uniref:hypothetical protein n=1 Tax=Anaerocolumna sp. AGMB13020 TaxID=3081750 RepID=UPI0029540A66|nr:hypothetical protein [Anaerocolumna sp. AGMB13020]WOO35778.1 hypothetical protein R2R35_18530 [Anaerocolumna sp. AGMB13020]
MKKKTEIKSNKWKIMIISTLPVLLLLFFLIISILPQKSTKSDAATENHLDISLDENEDISTDEEKELTLLDYADVKDYTYKDEDKQEDDNSLTYKPSRIKEENDMTNEDSKQVTEDAEKEIDSIAAEGKDEKSNESQIEPSSSNSKDSNKIVIDESSDTMKDETKQNEYKGEDSPEEIEFFDVSPEKGSDIKGDVPASGVHLGNWN